MVKAYTSRRKSDGRPRKLRKSNNQRAQRRQARKIVEAKRGKKLPKKSLVHHKDTNTAHNSPKNLKVMSGRKSHGRLHPGKHK
ncbi:hypothetical protein LCGC14_2618660 [marine sediment metagenome]|uniref:HNH nuclease domain-containing protein n=1 Tax=marine sediment metagenome TaxID=412755 RepID=A0A0F9A3P0_9ZZZZ